MHAASGAETQDNARARADGLPTGSTFRLAVIRACCGKSA